jgi:tetratricopeptide (TPR) repeat protein
MVLATPPSSLPAGDLPGLTVCGRLAVQESSLLQPRGLYDCSAHLRKALAVQLDLADAHNNVGLALLESGRAEEAIGRFRKARELRRDYAQAKEGLNLALRQKRQLLRSLESSQAD